MPKVEPKPLLEVEIDKFTGINNRKNWEELTINELYSAPNVDITLNNKIKSRDGETLIKAGNYKDGKYFPQMHFTLIVKDNNTFVKLDEAWVETVLQNNIGSNHMSYAYHSYKVFYTNESIIGYVDNSGVHSLDTPTKSYRANPRPGQLLEVHGFRLWIARGKELSFTDVGKFHSVWMQRNIRQLPHRITMIRSIGKTLYVSDLENTYIIKGLNPYKATLDKVKPYPAIFDTGGVIDGILVGEGLPGRVAWWASKEGVCIGTEGGDVINLTEMGYDFPVCIRGASLHRFKGNTSHFVVTVVS